MSDFLVFVRWQGEKGDVGVPGSTVSHDYSVYTVKPLRATLAMLS